MTAYAKISQDGQFLGVLPQAPVAVARKDSGKIYALPIVEGARPTPGRFQFLIGPTYEVREDDALRSWSVVSVPLAEAKEQANGIINSARRKERTTEQLVDVGGERLVPVDVRNEEDERNIIGLMIGATLRLMQGDAETVEFRGADDKTYTLTPVEVVALGKTVAGTISQIWENSWALKTAIAAATTVEEVETLLKDAAL